MRPVALTIILLILAIVIQEAFGQSPIVSGTEKQSYLNYPQAIPFSVTFTTSVERSGSMVACMSDQMSFDGTSGYDCCKVLDASAMPDSGEPPRNLFFKEGEVFEQNLRAKSWVKYACTQQQFIEYVNYCYTAAGIIGSTADYAVQNPGVCVATAHGEQVTYKLSEKMTKEIGITEITVEPGTLRLISAEAIDPTKHAPRYRWDYSFDAPCFLDGGVERPPAHARTIANPLKERMVYL
jgi:hypothetical protein